jgi:hypothetical protein
LAATVGAVTAVDRVPSHVVPDAPYALHPAHTFTTVGPSGGLGAGFDGTLAPFLAIGPEVRAVVFGLDRDPANVSGPRYHPQIGFTLGLTLTALVDRTR